MILKNINIFNIPPPAVKYAIFANKIVYVRVCNEIKMIDDLLGLKSSVFGSGRKLKIINKVSS